MQGFVKLCGVATVVALLASAGSAGGAKNLKGEIKIDGSSTVYLISEAMATNFRKLNPGVNIQVGISGTGGGFKKFYNGETDISDASRPIKQQEIDMCKKNGIAYVELQIAWDGLAVILHKENDWAGKMTVEQLRKIWHPDLAAKRWSDVDPSWPNETILLYGAGADSGTFDYFTEVINGKERLCRSDYSPSEDDNNTIKGVERNKYAMGFLGLAYYEAHRDKLSVVAVKAKDGKEFVTPSKQTVVDGSYSPLGRPLFIYVKTPSLQRAEVREFVDYYMRRPDIVEQVKYVPLNTIQQARERKKLTGALKAAK